MTPDAAAPLPFSRPLRVEDIKQSGSLVRLHAEPAECAALAAALGLESLEALDGEFRLARNGDRVKLEGRLRAAFHQLCVVTLDPFPVALEVPVRLDLSSRPPDLPVQRSREGEIDLELRFDEDDPPEPIRDGVVDLGAIATEFLALALDPYPRKPGAAFAEPAPEAAAPSPFAALAALKPGS